MATPTSTFKIERTRKRAGFGRFEYGNGFVMFGRKEGGKWFERHYATVEAAVRYTEKRGWKTGVSVEATAS